MPIAASFDINIALGHQRLRPIAYDERLPPVLYFNIGISGVWGFLCPY